MPDTTFLYTFCWLCLRREALVHVVACSFFIDLFFKSRLVFLTCQIFLYCVV